MKSLCQFAHEYWKKNVNNGDIAIDATIGNGHDTAFLAKLVGEKGRVIGYDIQLQGIENAKILLQNEGLLNRVDLKHKSHETFEEKEAKLIVYNLGYLPSSDKTITTLSHTTINSLKSALSILQTGGLLSVMAYVGHQEGKKEFEEIFQFFQNLPKETYLVSHHVWLNRIDAPTLFLVQK